MHGELQTVFDAEPPQSIEQAIANEDDLVNQNTEYVIDRSCSLVS